MSVDFILKSKEISDENKTIFLFDNAKTFYNFADLEEIEPIKNML